MNDYFKDSLKIKDIKKFINKFDDDDNVLIECYLDEEEYKKYVIAGTPFHIELCNYELEDDNFSGEAGALGAGQSGGGGA